MILFAPDPSKKQAYCSDYLKELVLGHVRPEPTRFGKQAIFASFQVFQCFVGKCRYNVTSVDHQGFKPV
jgi:hypothetical protein